MKRDHTGLRPLSTTASVSFAKESADRNTKPSGEQAKSLHPHRQPMQPPCPDAGLLASVQRTKNGDPKVPVFICHSQAYSL